MSWHRKLTSASSDDVDDLNARNVCFRCVGEPFLSDEIKRMGSRRQCTYCKKTRRAYRLCELADRIDTAFGEHYYRTSDQPSGWRGSDWEREGTEVVQAITDAADITEEVAGDVQRILEDRYDDLEAAKMGDETEFAETSYYAEKRPDGRAWHEEWDSFEHSLKTEARFFSQAASTHLAAVFEGIENMATLDDRPVIAAAGPGQTIVAIYRARVFQSEDPLTEALCRPDLHVGPPPTRLATAGRMNPSGISVFYGANDPKVAIAEVRPPVGSRVIVARFDLLRELKLLDLAALSGVSSSGSIFDPEFSRRLERETFLGSLSDRLSKPVMPDDEAFDYLPTQAISDFLAAQEAPALDGIIFPSVQAANGAVNVVLFHKASRVQQLEIPDGTAITADTGLTTEDGWESYYSVSEEVPRSSPPPEVDAASPKNSLLNPEPSDWWPVERVDPRFESLRVALDSVMVHEIARVDFITHAYTVHRHRYEKSDPNDLSDF